MNKQASFPEWREKKTNRREFLDQFRHLLLGTTALTLFPLSLRAEDIEALKLDYLDVSSGLLLAQVCRLLFPHEKLSDKVYLDVVADVDADMAGSESRRTMIQQIPLALRQKAGGDWHNKNVEQQLEILTSFQREEWFKYLRNRTAQSLYRNPQVWKLVGYEGSSIEQGGYLHRGFDDIDWLE